MTSQQQGFSQLGQKCILWDVASLSSLMYGYLVL